MTITSRHRAARRHQRAVARTTVATRPVGPSSRYSAQLQALVLLRDR